METEAIPYDEIYETRDRSWTTRLLERLVEPKVEQDEIDQIEGVFHYVCDPRADEVCIQIAENRNLPLAVRKAAAAIPIAVDAEVVRRWWASDDDLLREWGFRLMREPEFRPIIEEVAGDPTHEFHKVAIGIMTFGFSLPRHTKMKLKALTHPNAEVRQWAADVLLWDEPVIAEEPLIQATYDTEVAVVEAACNSLRYYPTQKAFLRVSQLTQHPDETVRKTATESVAEIRGNFLYAALHEDEVVRNHIRRWLKPIWEQLAFTQEELNPEKKERQIITPDSPPPLDVKRAKALLTKPDTSVHALNDLFWNYEWETISAEDRSELRPILLQHPDWAVRQASSKVFEVWGDQESLMEMMSDRQGSVRRAATYHLSNTPPFKQEIADFAWKYMHERFDPSTGEYEGDSLSIYAAHANREEAIPRLVAVAKNTELTEDQRYEAVNLLRHMDAEDVLAELMIFISDPPPLTWMFHVALLECADEYNLPVLDISHLVNVDHLDVQRAVAPLVKRKVPKT